MPTTLTSAVGAILYVYTTLRDPFVSEIPTTILVGEQQDKLDLAHFLGLESVELHPAIGRILHSSLTTIAGCGETLSSNKPRVKLQKIVVGTVMRRLLQVLSIWFSFSGWCYTPDGWDAALVIRTKLRS